MRSTTALAALLTTALTPLSLPTPASAAPATYADDFNGDGYRDLVVGAPDATVSGKESAGAVVVLYGSASGPGTTKKLLISQNATGVEGAAEAGDGFGSSVASADLDADGYADLLVGAPYEDVTGAKTRGSVTVLWGGAQGLKGSAVLPAPSPFSDGDTKGCSYGTGVAAVNPKAAPGAAEVSVAGWCAGLRLTGPFTRAGKPARTSLRTATPSLDDAALGDLDGNGRPESVDISVGLSDHPSGACTSTPRPRPPPRSPPTVTTWPWVTSTATATATWSSATPVTRSSTGLHRRAPATRAARSRSGRAGHTASTPPPSRS
ncbi:hypothetical protein SAV14893_039250 [Streptomyces avermitilis]|uniref:Integrin-like protein n=1 Tax=Streptomyces avermitilis TaxID=33903 RepID=A0A4D4LT80_STRAX|nr:hypothetical protein SAV14893_039250 [Streptomyces avermitilis]